MCRIACHCNVSLLILILEEYGLRADDLCIVYTSMARVAKLIWQNIFETSALLYALVINHREAGFIGVKQTSA